MLQFIHTYTDESFPGLFAQGLWRDGDGLKFMHKTYLPAHRSFNEAAQRGGLLHQRLSELRCPFYIDRYQGGIPFPHLYEYDPELLDEYKQMLGDKFLGFQMHEWASNYANEIIRVREAKEKWMAEHGSLDGMWEQFIDAARTDPMALFVEAWAVEEWAEMEIPQTVDEFVGELYRMWQKRADATSCPLFPADSYFIAPRIEIACGAKLLLPEIGWQIPGTRLQIAYTRGMARGAGIPWGVYYECWAHNQGANGVLTIPYASDSNDNEWTELELRDEMLQATGGKIENGGSSRSLQERSWVYAYFSGAQIMGEEYGVCNTFMNERDFALSEYGQVKKKFLDFATAHPNLGETYTPIAIALPSELPIYSLEAEDKYLGFPLDAMNADMAEKIRHARRVLQKLLYKDMPGYDTTGGDAHCIQNSAYPDVFDILHGDMADALDKYEYILDLTCDPDFAQAHSNRIGPEDVDALLPTLLPCVFSQQLHAVYNRLDDGWLVLAMNNDGVIRSVQNGEQVMADAAIVSDLILRDPTARVEKMEGSGELISGDDGYRVSIGAGQWLILTIQ